MHPVEDGEGPLWKVILESELLWVGIAALVILGVAFALATS